MGMLGNTHLMMHKWQRISGMQRSQTSEIQTRSGVHERPSKWPSTVRSHLLHH